MERALRVLEVHELEPEAARQHRQQHQLRILLHAVDQLARDAVDQVGLAALEHGEPRRRLRHGHHRQVLDVDRLVVALEGLELELHARFMRHELVGPGADRLALEPVRADLLVILRRHDPAGAVDVAGAHQQEEVQERLLELEADGSAVDDLDRFGLALEGGGQGAAVILVAELHVFGRDRLAVVELGALAQPEGRAHGILGELVALRQRRMVVELRAGIFDQGVVQGMEEVVRRRRAVMLLRVEPTRRHGGVPGHDHLALRCGFGRAEPAGGKRQQGRRRGPRQQCTSRDCAEAGLRPDFARHGLAPWVARPVLISEMPPVRPLL